MFVHSVEKSELAPFEMPRRFRTDIAYFMTPAGERGAPQLGSQGILDPAGRRSALAVRPGCPRRLAAGRTGQS